MGKRESSADRIASHLRRRILLGELPAGLRLPPERTLAVDLDANRHTIREALRILEAQGLLETRQGSGAVVLDFRLRGRLEMAPYYFEVVGLHPSIQQEIESFLTLRRVVLVEAVALATREASVEMREKLSKISDEIQNSQNDARKIVELDFAFYSLVIEATGRLLYRWVLNSFAERVQPVIEAFAFIWPRPENYFLSMKNLSEQMIKNAPEKARQAAKKHLEQTDQQIMETISIVLEAGIPMPGTEQNA